MDDLISRDQKEQGDSDSHRSGAETDDKGLCVEYLRYIPLGSSDGTEDSDLLLPFQDAYVGDDSDHDGRNHQRNRHKGYQDITDHIDNVRHRRHQSSHHIGVGDRLLLLPFCLHPGIVIVQNRKDLFLTLKISRIDGDSAGAVQVCIAQHPEIIVVCRILAGHHGSEKLCQFILIHRHLDGIHKSILVNADCILKIAPYLSQSLLDGACHTASNLPCHLLHGSFQILGELGHRLFYFSADLLLDFLPQIPSLGLYFTGNPVCKIHDIRACHDILINALLAILGLQVIQKFLTDRHRIRRAVLRSIILVSGNQRAHHLLKLLWLDVDPDTLSNNLLRLGVDGLLHLCRLQIGKDGSHVGLLYIVRLSVRLISHYQTSCNFCQLSFRYGDRHVGKDQIPNTLRKKLFCLIRLQIIADASSRIHLLQLLLCQAFCKARCQILGHGLHFLL